MKNNLNKKEGIISISSKGTGYVRIPELKEDPEIDFRHLKTALHGDTVEIILHPKGSGRQGAEVSRIISRAKVGFTGVLEQENNIFFLKPDDTKMYTDILIPKNGLHGAKIGQKVFVKIISWKDANKAPLGEIEKILGRVGDNDVEMEAIAIEKGFNAKLPEKVEKEGQNIKIKGIIEKDYIGRKDFRKTLTFTIDPDDAKDFDDAISFREIKKDEYEIGIHIADVSHYVKINSALDIEARERGTSVYLVDRTIPMLPETLSNDLCSLVPHKDRLTMSAVFVLDKNAQVKAEYYGHTVIHSQKRFTYEEAENGIHNKEASLHKELSILNNLAKKLT
ncbi:MAG: RNB domain-containing ribonuclease, partial [Patescibacteria group bacterium]